MRDSRDLRTGDALVVVDVQNDFLPGGALAVDRGHEVIDTLNAWIRAGDNRGIPLYFSRDWHPRRHPSFIDEGGIWPPHCIQDTEGAAFAPTLSVPASAVIVTKGTRFDQDQNSAFDETGLQELLYRDDVERLFVGGLAEDVCVAQTVIDGRRFGFDVHLISEATRPVTEEGRRQARQQMNRAGVVIEAQL